MKAKISILIEEDKWKDHFPSLKILTKNVLIYAAEYMKICLKKQAISVCYTSDDQICLLNKTYRQQNKPTNILSFACPQDNDYLGDMALAWPLIGQEAENDNKPLHDHLTHLLIHGFLHLIGYDHENEKEAEEMENLEKTILSFWNIKDPYAPCEIERTC